MDCQERAEKALGKWNSKIGIKIEICSRKIEQDTEL